MSRTGRLVLGVVLVGIIIVGGVIGWIWFNGGGEASAPISAPTLAVGGEAGAATTPTLAAAADAEATAITESEAAPAQAAAGSTTIFNIVPEESEVRFLLDEDLRGERITVVGRTNQVAGQIGVNFDAPASSQVGVIRINVRTFATDNEFRNRAIRTAILQTDQFEFAEFTPTEVTGLPESVTIGEPFTFQISGNLLLRTITQPVTFEATVTPVSETRLEGTARTVVTRGEYQLNIPSVPSVANVEEEVELEVDFVAVADA